jgi:hypothetical protein
MIINNGSQLSVEYFKSYFRLVMNSQQCTVIDTKEIIFNRIFRGDHTAYGNYTFQNFEHAYKEISKIDELITK